MHPSLYQTHPPLSIIFQSGQPNLLDRGVLEQGEKSLVHTDVLAEWGMVDEIPFDFNRRRMSVIVNGKNGIDASLLLICKVSGIESGVSVFHIAYFSFLPHSALTHALNNICNKIISHYALSFMTSCSSTSHTPKDVLYDLKQATCVC